MIIGSLATVVAPTAFALLPENRVDLVLSGRLTDTEGRPLSAAHVVSGPVKTNTDADGRFVLRTASRHYQVADIDGYVANAHADIDGTWRATLSLTI